MTREDNSQAGQTVTEVNTMLENYCEATNMHLITHENITSRSLNKSKLHLNRYGSSNLAKNFKSGSRTWTSSKGKLGLGLGLRLGLGLGLVLG